MRRGVLTRRLACPTSSFHFNFSRPIPNPRRIILLRPFPARPRHTFVTLYSRACLATAQDALLWVLAANQFLYIYSPMLTAWHPQCGTFLRPFFSRVFSSLANREPPSCSRVLAIAESSTVAFRVRDRTAESPTRLFYGGAPATTPPS
jgi:hypothetical protein